MAKQEVQLIVTTDATGAITGINQFRSSMNKMETDTGGCLSKIKEHWLGMSAAIYTAKKVLDTVWNLAEMAAAFEEQKGILDNLAKKYETTSDRMLIAMRKASEGLIADSDLMQTALGGIAKGLNPDQMIKLAGAAQILGDTVGQSATETFKNLSEALESGRTKALKGYAGATIDLTSVFGDLEKKLTDTEKAQAMYSLIMIHATKLQQEQTSAVSGAADEMERMEASYKNATLAGGNLFKTIVAGAYDAGVALSEMYKIYGDTLGGVAAIPTNKPMSHYEDSKEMQGPVDALAGYKKQIADLKNILQARPLEQSEEFLKKWEKTKQTIGLSGYTKDLALLDAEYNAYKKFVTDKVALDQWYTAGKTDLLRKESLRQAQEEQKILSIKLAAAEKYYQTLQEMMALAKQRSDVLLSGETLISKMNESDASLSSQDKYYTQESLLNKQFAATRLLTGQDRIKALEDYKNAVFALQQQFSKGIDASGFQREITAKEILSDATFNIRRAMEDQVAAIKLLTEEKEKQIEKDRVWGSSLAAEAEKAKAGIEGIKTTMKSLSDQIAAMEKTVKIEAIDQASSVVATIAAAIAALQDKTITINANYVSSGMSSITSATAPVSEKPIPYADDAVDAEIPQYASGTNYVPRTGIYKLHQGEAVIPAAQNNNNSRSIKMGDINIVIPANAAPQRPEDWRAIVRNYIKPELQKLNS